MYLRKNIHAKTKYTEKRRQHASACRKDPATYADFFLALLEDNSDVSLRDLSSSRSRLDEEFGIASMVTETLRLNMHVKTKQKI